MNLVIASGLLTVTNAHRTEKADTHVQTPATDDLTAGPQGETKDGLLGAGDEANTPGGASSTDVAGSGENISSSPAVKGDERESGNRSSISTPQPRATQLCRSGGGGARDIKTAADKATGIETPPPG